MLWHNIALMIHLYLTCDTCWEFTDADIPKEPHEILLWLYFVNCMRTFLKSRWNIPLYPCYMIWMAYALPSAHKRKDWRYQSEGAHRDLVWSVNHNLKQLYYNSLGWRWGIGGVAILIYPTLPQSGIYAYMHAFLCSWTSQAQFCSDFLILIWPPFVEAWCTSSLTVSLKYDGKMLLNMYLAFHEHSSV